MDILITCARNYTSSNSCSQQFMLALSQVIDCRCQPLEPSLRSGPNTQFFSSQFTLFFLPDQIEAGPTSHHFLPFQLALFQSNHTNSQCPVLDWVCESVCRHFINAAPLLPSSKCVSTVCILLLKHSSGAFGPRGRPKASQGGLPRPTYVYSHNSIRINTILTY